MRRRQHKNADRLRDRYLQLSRTLDIDVEYQVFALVRGRFKRLAVGAVVIAENLGIFEELAACQAILEVLTADEDIVDAGGLGWGAAGALYRRWKTPGSGRF